VFYLRDEANSFLWDKDNDINEKLYDTIIASIDAIIE
jgi:hypothetical protein